eukprot:274598-Prymnesium_polylepis.1
MPVGAAPSFVRRGTGAARSRRGRFPAQIAKARGRGRRTGRRVTHAATAQARDACRDRGSGTRRR